MIDKTAYDASGRLGMQWSFASDDDVRANVRAGMLLVDGHIDGETFYVLDGVITPRPAQSTQLAGMVLTGVPVPATLIVDRAARYPVTESLVELDFPYPGTYRIEIIAHPYLDWSEEVVVQ